VTYEIPAGWYPDPTVAGQIRYWNGNEWTDDVSAGGPVAAERPLKPTSTLTPTGNDWIDEVDKTIAGPVDQEVDDSQILRIPHDSDTRYRKLIAIAVAIVLLLGGVSWLVLGGGANGESSRPTAGAPIVSTTTSLMPTTTSPTTTSTVASTTTAPPVVVTNVVGMDQTMAIAQLQAAGFLVNTDSVESADLAPGTVTSADPPPGSPTAPGGTITITVATAPVPECNDLTGPIPSTQFSDVLALGSPTDQLAVSWAESVRIISGITPDTFGVDQPLSRGALATILYRYFCSPTPTRASRFTDVQPGAFYADPIAWASERGIMSGTSPTLFGPDGPATRGQWVTVVWRALGSPPATIDLPFTDVSPGVFYEQALKWAFSNNLISGVDATTFDAYRPLTRLNAVSLLYLLELTINPPVG